jgi:heptaprenyl diphosphate synthase
MLAGEAAGARAELGKLPDSPATQALASLTEYVVDRTG